MCGGTEAGALNYHQEVVEAVFPVGETQSKDTGEDDMLCAPCEEEEEEAAIPSSLPTVYQPTHSEYLDLGVSIITHTPWNIWTTA